MRASPRFPMVIMVAASMVLLMALGACGESRKTNSGTATTGTETQKTRTPTGPAVGTVKVSETEYKLAPANPKVAKAGVVSFVATNHGKIPHALEVEGPSGEARTKAIAPGGSATLKVDLAKPGAYTWYCPLDNHKGLGMKGKVTVAGGASGGGASTSTQSSGRSASSGGY
jgi:uncharacterized cupredoxin-like copper-binding protein